MGAADALHRHRRRGHQPGRRLAAFQSERRQHHAAQQIGVGRLVEERHQAALLAGLAAVLARVGGGHQHRRHGRQLGVAGDALQGFDAVHVGHVGVHHQDVVVVQLHRRHRRRARRHRARLQAQVGQLDLQHVAHRFAVVHHQHALAQHRRRQRRGARGLVARQLHGDAETEAAADARFAVDADHAAHLAHQLLRDRQPQSGAAVQARGAGVGLGEGLEQAGLLLVADPQAAVLDDEAQPDVAVAGHRGLVVALDPQFDVAARGELECVADQVDQDLAQAQRVAQQVGRHVRRRPDHQFQSALRGPPREQVGQLAQGVGQVEGQRLQFQLARFDLGEVQHVVDDLQQALAGAADLAEVVQRLRRQVQMRAQACEAEDGVHRRADFVADVGQEVALGAGGRFGVGARLLQQPQRARLLVGRDEGLLQRLEQIEVGGGESRLVLVVFEDQIAFDLAVDHHPHRQQRADVAWQRIAVVDFEDVRRDHAVGRRVAQLGLAQVDGVGVGRGVDAAPGRAQRQRLGAGLAHQRHRRVDALDDGRLMQDGVQQGVEIELLVDRLDDGVEFFQVLGARVHQRLQRLALVVQLPHAPAHQAPCEQAGGQQVAQPRPPGLVPGRQHHHPQLQLFGVPQGVAVAAAQAQAVAAGRQMVVGGDAARGVGLHPALVEAFQQMGVAVALRRREVQRGQLHFEALVLRLERQRRAVVACQLGRGDRLLVQAHRADDQRRAVAPVVQAARIHHRHAGGGAEHQVAFGRDGAGTDEEGAEGQAVGAGQRARLEGGGVDHGDAVGGGGPDAAHGVGLHGHDGAGGQARQGADPLEFRHALRIAPGHDADAAAVGAYPQPAARVDHQRADDGLRQRGRHGGIGAYLFHLAGFGIQPVQAVAGGDPQRAVAVGRHRVDAVVGQAAGVGRALHVAAHGVGLRVVAQQAVESAQPQFALARQDGADARIGTGLRQRHAAHAASLGAGTVEAQLGADPGLAGTGLGQRQHHPVGQRAVRAGRVRAQHGGAVAVGVHDVDALVGQRDPHLALLVRHQRGDGGFLRALGAEHRIDALVVRIVEVDAAFGRHPDHAAAVAQQGGGAVVAQAEGHGRLVLDAVALVAAAAVLDHAAAVGAGPPGAGGGFDHRQHHVGLQLLDALDRQDAAAVGLRVDDADAALERAEGDLAHGVLAQRHDGVAPAGLAFAADGDLGDGAALAQARQAGARAYPQGAGVVHQQGAHLVVRQPGMGFVGVAAQRALHGVVVFQAVRRAYPQVALGVAGDGADLALAQFIVEARELFAAFIEHGDAGGRRAYPQAAAPVHVQHLDKVAGQRGGVGGVVMEAAHMIAIPARQAGLGADPDVAVAVLRQRHADRVRQPLFQAKVLEQRRGQLAPALGPCGGAAAQHRACRQRRG
ncbi:hypothetical protein DUGA2_05550 [Duganella sp. HH101]|nr:hypothetical protein DUGA2_05550 [Duganella sp. HH101]